MDAMETKLFGTLLKRFRERARLSQTALGYKIGKQSRGSIQAWEAGGHPDERETVLVLASVLGLTEGETDRFLLAANFLQEYNTQGILFSGTRGGKRLSLADVYIYDDSHNSVIDITLQNSSTQTVLPTRMQIEVLDVSEFYYCDEDDDPTRSYVKVSKAYDVELSPALKGKQMDIKVAHQLWANEVDRLQVRIGQKLVNPALAYVWYYLKIMILANEPESAIEIEPVLLSMPPVDTDMTDVWSPLQTPCAERNKSALRRMAGLPANRSTSVETAIRQILGE